MLGQGSPQDTPGKEAADTEGAQPHSPHSIGGAVATAGDHCEHQPAELQLHCRCTEFLHSIII